VKVSILSSVDYLKFTGWFRERNDTRNGMETNRHYDDIKMHPVYRE
jgi:hypothetical protein